MLSQVSFRPAAGFIFRHAFVAIALFSGLTDVRAQTQKQYDACDYTALLATLRAYEDTLAAERSVAVVRQDYRVEVTDLGIADKTYWIFRCNALLDSIAALQADVAFSRLAPPTMDTDSISSITATGATFHGKYTSDGGSPVTHLWFRYGLTAGNLVDSVAVTGTTSPFTKAVTTLTGGSVYYVAVFGKNAAGTASGDTMSFTAAAPFACGNTVTFDGYSYRTATVAGECWFVDNLRTTVLNDGTPIPGAGESNVTWKAYTTPAQCVYNDDPSNLTTYGRLYNYFAVQSGKLCPSGWHVSSRADWDAVQAAYPGTAATALKSSSSDSPAWNGTNTSGFSVLPAGTRHAFDGSFDQISSQGYFWDVPATGNPYAYGFWNGSTISLASYLSSAWSYGNSIRCVQD
jgi:uncharacterized protein (TIGR02145 family)